MPQILSATSLAIDPALTAEDVAAVKALFIEYQQWLDVSLCFQGFDEEMARLPEGYDLLLLARAEGTEAGAIGLRPLPGSAPEDRLCEMKRLYVRPAFQGRGLGRTLSVRLIEAAREMGYRSMRLDTLDRLEAATALYRDLGFTDCAAYYDNPLDGVIYMELDLTAETGAP